MECTCDMTEAGQRTCPLHGEDEFLSEEAQRQLWAESPVISVHQAGG